MAQIGLKKGVRASVEHTEASFCHWLGKAEWGIIRDPWTEPQLQDWDGDKHQDPTQSLGAHGTLSQTPHQLDAASDSQVETGVTIR